MAHALDGGRILVSLQSGGGGKESLLDVLGMGQGGGLLLKFFLLALEELRLVNLTELELHKVGVFTPLLRLCLQLLQGLFGGTPRCVGCGVGFALSSVGGYGVERREQEVLFAHQQVLVLRMDVDDAGCEVAQRGERYGRIVEEGATFTSCGYFAAHDALVSVEVDVVFGKEGVEVQPADIELAFDNAFCCLCLYGSFVGSRTTEQAQCAKQDALTGTRLARDDHEASGDVDVELTDEGVMAYLKMTKHSGIKRIAHRGSSDEHGYVRRWCFNEACSTPCS